MAERKELPRGVTELLLEPDELLLGFRTYLGLDLPIIVRQRVNSQESQVGREVDLIVATIFESRFNFLSVLPVGWVILEPEVEQEIVELLLILLERSTVVDLAVVVSELHEHRDVREELCEQSLNFSMRVFEQFVAFFVEWLIWLQRNPVADQVTWEENEIWR